MDKVPLRLTARGNKRGLTLIELLVAFGLLGLLSFIMFLTMQTTKEAQLKQADAADIKTRALVARLHVAELMRGARLIVPNSGQPITNEVVFQAPTFTDGVLNVDVLGRPLFGNNHQLTMDSEGQLLHSEPSVSQVQRLADLGAEGEFSASREGSQVVVRMTVKDLPDDPGYEVELKYHVPQEVIPGSPYRP